MYIRVNCQRCGRSFELYNSETIRDKGRKCPHCQERVNALAWDKVVKAFEACTEASFALYRDDTSKTKFTVDYCDNSYYLKWTAPPPNMD